jgi:hypothetical protein
MAGLSFLYVAHWIALGSWDGSLDQVGRWCRLTALFIHGEIGGCGGV